MSFYLKVKLLYLVLVPLGLSTLTLFVMNMGLDETIAVLIVLIPGGGIFGVLSAKRMNLPDTFTARFLPIAAPILYTTVSWAVFMLISKGFYGHPAWFYYAILHFPYTPINFIASFIGDGWLMLWAPFFYHVMFALGFTLTQMKINDRPPVQLKQVVSFITVLCLATAIGTAVKWQRSKTVLPSYGFEYGGGYSSTDLTPYQITNPDNKLPRLEKSASFRIEERNDMPILDGAEAAYPVYSAFAKNVYKNIEDIDIKEEIVSFTNTLYAYERLLTGDVDIYFGAEPSEKQRKMAVSQGKELVMTSIGKEAFVFFVNPKNKVDNLNVSEIQDIYSGKINNWSQLNGSDERIIAFQRPENSGSQTLLEKIMGDTPIVKPLKEEVPEGMGGIIEQVADYRNYDNAIGFSFRFFATGMKANPDIKLLSINGIEPNPENIATGKYPFTANLYAITLKDNSKKTILPFLKWMQSKQGQEIVEKIGYIKL
jgi:phosphate transport system substrate-binding protein